MSLRLGENAHKSGIVWKKLGIFNHHSMLSISYLTVALPKGCFDHFCMGGASLSMNELHANIKLYNGAMDTDTAKPRNVKVCPATPLQLANRQATLQ